MPPPPRAACAPFPSARCSAASMPVASTASGRTPPGGYTLELEIPLAYTGGRLGFYLVNVGQRPGGKFETLGNISPLDTAAPPWLIYSPAALQTNPGALQPPGQPHPGSGQDNWLMADIPAARRQAAGTARKPSGCCAYSTAASCPRVTTGAHHPLPAAPGQVDGRGNGLGPGGHRRQSSLPGPELQRPAPSCRRQRPSSLTAA